jgi:hypothetical protein
LSKVSPVPDVPLVSPPKINVALTPSSGCAFNDTRDDACPERLRLVGAAESFVEVG